MASELKGSWLSGISSGYRVSTKLKSLEALSFCVPGIIPVPANAWPATIKKHKDIKSKVFMGLLVLMHSLRSYCQADIYLLLKWPDWGIEPVRPVSLSGFIFASVSISIETRNFYAHLLKKHFPYAVYKATIMPSVKQVFVATSSNSFDAVNLFGQVDSRCCNRMTVYGWLKWAGH